MLPITSAILFVSRGKTYIKPPPLSRQVSTVLEGTPWFFLISGKTNMVLAHSHAIFVSRMTSWVALLWFSELAACHMPWHSWQHHCPVEGREERRYLEGQGAGGPLSTQLQGPWKLLPRRLGEQGVVELKRMPANNQKSPQSQESYLHRAARCGLQGFLVRERSAGFCVACSSPGEGFPVCPDGVFVCFCPVLINSSLQQGWRQGWWSKLERLFGWLLLSNYSWWVLAHHTTPLLSTSWPLGCWELTGKECWVCLELFTWLLSFVSVEWHSYFYVWVCKFMQTCVWVCMHELQRIFWRGTWTSEVWGGQVRCCQASTWRSRPCALQSLLWFCYWSIHSAFNFLKLKTSQGYVCA